jgi:DNA-binding transcriptional MocR family regulator
MGLREEALRRSRLAASLLSEQTLVCHPGAYHAWLPMPRHAASQFSIVAASLGIAVTPPEAVMVDPEEDDSGIRLCLCGPPLDVLTKALTLLSGVGHFLAPGVTVH